MNGKASFPAPSVCEVTVHMDLPFGKVDPDYPEREKARPKWADF